MSAAGAGGGGIVANNFRIGDRVAIINHPILRRIVDGPAIITRIFRKRARHGQPANADGYIISKIELWHGSDPVPNPLPNMNNISIRDIPENFEYIRPENFDKIIPWAENMRIDEVDPNYHPRRLHGKFKVADKVHYYYFPIESPKMKSDATIISGPYANPANPELLYEIGYSGGFSGTEVVQESKLRPSSERIMENKIASINFGNAPKPEKPAKSWYNITRFNNYFPNFSAAVMGAGEAPMHEIPQPKQLPPNIAKHIASFLPMKPATASNKREKGTGIALTGGKTRRRRRSRTK